MQQPYKIVIVEDEALIAEGLQIILENNGFDVVAKYYSYNEAFEGLIQLEYDLVLLDINLGSSKTGIDLAREVLTPQLKPFIYLTAYDDKATIAEAIATAPSTYLVKPVGSSILFASIQLALFRHLNTDNISAGKNNDADYFYVKLGKQNIKVMWTDVNYLTHEKNYVRLNGHNIPTSGYLIRSSLHNVLNNVIPKDLLPHFIQVNRRAIVRKSSITKHSSTELFIGDEGFDIGETFATDIRQYIQLR
jgi:two-component system, LytTR family, response regulator LytT